MSYDERFPYPSREEDALSEAECRRLLASYRFGRVGITSGGLPCILPVCYVFHDDAVVFRTGPGSKLRAAASGDVLAFEVDHLDAETGVGWSVLALGRASVLDPWSATALAERMASRVSPIATDRVVTLRCEIVTGRRLQLTT